MLRQFVLTSMKFNVLFKAQHIPGKLNVIADYLSRSKFREAKKWAPWLAEQSTTVPSYLATEKWLG